MDNDELNERWKKRCESLENDVFDLFGFCYCGQPDKFIDGLAHYLNMVAMMKNDNSAWLYTDFDIPYMYLADKAGLTDHGGSVLSAWLTPKGEELLDRLNFSFLDFRNQEAK